MDSLKFWVNGETCEVPVDPGEMLADVLRYRLGMTGTKIGCNESECGTCTVLLDGLPVFSCSIPAVKVAGRQVMTIEGLAEGEKLHPIQDAFVKHGAVQCGFCTPGLIMSSYAMLKENPDPTKDELRTELKASLCRCGTYPAVERALKAAAKSIATGDPVTPPKIPMLEGLGLGGMPPRPDAVSKVTGKAKYTDDYIFPEMLHGMALRAGEPHAIVKKINISKATELEGVHVVLTAQDLHAERYHGMLVKDWPVLVGIGERVRYVGDAVALVSAESRSIAREALALIDVEYESLPVISDPFEAGEEGVPALHESGNLLKHIEVNKGEIEQGFKGAKVILEDVYLTPSYEHAFMEPECSVARPLPDGRMEVYVGSQVPYEDRHAIADCLGLETDNVRVIGTVVGGGFGGKEDIAGQVHAALLAQATGRPVKVLYDRHESLLVHPKRHATHLRVKLGANEGGELSAAQIELYGDTGAYASLGAAVMARATTHSTGPYVIPNVRADCYAMYTNNPPAGALRGFGVLQSAFAIESAMDQLAEQLGMDPIELRRMNALRKNTETNTGQLLTESVGLLECINRAEAEMKRLAQGRPLFVSRQASSNPNLRRAWGFAAAYKNSGLGGGVPDIARAAVGLRSDGFVEVRTSSAEIGQGLPLVLQTIAASELGSSIDRVHVLLSDTDLTPDGGPTTASRQSYITGNAVRYATKSLMEAVAGTLAEKFDIPLEDVKFENGAIKLDGRVIAYQEAISHMEAEGRDPWVIYEYVSPATMPLGEGGDMHFAYGFAAYGVEVEMNLQSGQVSVLTVVAACDVGKAINPLGLLGQLEGGVIMGLGHALTEEFVVDDGRVFTDHLARYRMPNIKQTPKIIPIIVEHPTSEGPLGAKGVGEITTIPMAPAITNAIYHACGVRVKSLPVDQDWLALQIASQDHSFTAS